MRCPYPHDEVTEVEIRRVFEANDFGEAFTPERRTQEERVMAKGQSQQAKLRAIDTDRLDWICKCKSSTVVG